MTPQTMLEKLCNTFLQEIDGAPSHVGGENLRCVVLDGNFDVIDGMRAVLQALREPTEDVRCGSEADPVQWDYECGMCLGAKNAWNSIIDAILQEKA